MTKIVLICFKWIGWDCYGAVLSNYRYRVGNGVDLRYGVNYYNDILMYAIYYNSMFVFFGNLELNVPWSNFDNTLNTHFQL